MEAKISGIFTFRSFRSHDTVFLRFHTDAYLPFTFLFVLLPRRDVRTSSFSNSWIIYEHRRWRTKREKLERFYECIRLLFWDALARRQLIVYWTLGLLIFVPPHWCACDGFLWWIIRIKNFKKIILVESVRCCVANSRTPFDVRWSKKSHALQLYGRDLWLWNITFNATSIHVRYLLWFFFFRFYKSDVTI